MTKSPAGGLTESEGEFASAVIDYAKLRGWLVAHFRPAQTARGWRTPMQGDPGYPDLTMARGGRVVFAELKSEAAPKKLPSGQQAWREEMNGEFVPKIAHVWRPSDWDTVLEVLR